MHSKFKVRSTNSRRSVSFGGFKAGVLTFSPAGEDAKSGEGAHFGTVLEIAQLADFVLTGGTEVDPPLSSK